MGVRKMEYLNQEQKDRIISKLHERYSPTMIGELDRCPPNGEYFVTMYFENEYSFTIKTYYNVTVEDFDHTFNFRISNVSNVGNETTVTMKVEES